MLTREGDSKKVRYFLEKFTSELKSKIQTIKWKCLFVEDCLSLLKIF